MLFFNDFWCSAIENSPSSEKVNIVLYGDYSELFLVMLHVCMEAESNEHVRGVHKKIRNNVPWKSVL